MTVVNRYLKEVWQKGEVAKQMSDLGFRILYIYEDEDSLVITWQKDD